MPSVEFHFDFGSPNAYLAHLVIPQMQRSAGVEIRYVPVLLGGLFKATNNASPMVSEQGILNKREYRQVETARFLRDWNVAPLVANPHFPVNTLKIMRGAVHAEHRGFLPQYVDAVFNCMWQQALNMDDDAVMCAALESAGLPSGDIITGINQAPVKSALIANTEGSVARGNFGSPSFFVGEQMFFGKNTCKDVVAEVLRA